MENKNTLIALILIMAIWFGYTLLYPPEPLEEQTAQKEQQQEQSATTDIGARAEPAATAAGPVEAPKVADDKTAEARDVVIDSGIYKAVLTTNGARIKEFTLKNYQQSAKKNSPAVKLVQEGPSRHYTIKTFGTEGLSLPENAVFTLQGEQSDLRLEQGESRRVHFAATLDSGAVVHKIYNFHGDKYHFDVEVRYGNRGDKPLKGAFALSLVNRWDESMIESRYEFVGPTTYDGEDIHKDEVEDLAEEGAEEYQAANWTGFGTKYFVSIVDPENSAYDYFRIEKGRDFVENKVVSPYHTIAPGSSVSMSYLVYMGPKDNELLKAAGRNFHEILDFGFFSVLSRPLLTFLNFIYGFLGNYGMAIILLTVIIKAIFWPLTQKSYKSMKAMQTLQPQMQKIREKYKNDRERLNRELMELYKDKRVNPLGGCLPMLVQIPIFIALYKVLLLSIELRHAPFALWLTDLSAKDPYYITPILMGATMFLQQKMTPTTMDPTQAKIFMLMPVVFTFIFLNFPSGLVIYWLINNVLTIGQQALINRKEPAKA